MEVYTQAGAQDHCHSVTPVCLVLPLLRCGHTCSTWYPSHGIGAFSTCQGCPCSCSRPWREVARSGRSWPVCTTLHLTSEPPSCLVLPWLGLQHWETLCLGCTLPSPDSAACCGRAREGALQTGPYTVLNPGPNTFLGKAQTGRTATRLNVGNIALALNSLPSGNGRDGQRNLTFCVW